MLSVYVTWHFQDSDEINEWHSFDATSRFETRYIIYASFSASWEQSDRALTTGIKYEYTVLQVRLCLLSFYLLIYLYFYYYY